MSISKYRILALLILSLIFIGTSANDKVKDRYQDLTIRFSKSSLTVKEALEELNRLPDISVVYNGNETFLAFRISLPHETITVKEALEEIREQAPVDIVFTNNHVIVKSRKLEETYMLKGIVKDVQSDETLIAADIYISGTTKGTVTDLNGEYSFRLKPGNYQMVCKYVGYKDKWFVVTLYQDKTVPVFLEMQQHEIQEVNVTGTLGEVEDIETGRPIEKIEARTVNQLNTNDVNDALHGRINGVWSTKVSGAPGDHNKVRIRGISSIFGSTDPLYVVDGMIVPVVNFKTLGIADLNSHDVNSITILKDASSSALYGYLGGNGVVIIETKKGGGETRFNFSVKKGFQKFSKRYDLMNSEDFLTNLAYSDSLIGTGFYQVHPVQDIWEKYPVYRDSLGNTIGSEDFQEELFQTGNISEYQLSGQGNFKKIDYYISGNYYAHEGVVTSSRYDKYTLTGNFSRIYGDKLSFRLLYKGSWQENLNNLDNYQGNNIIYRGINYEPGYRYTPDSFLNNWGRLYLSDYTGELGSTLGQLSDFSYSPDMLFYQQEKKKSENSHSVNLQGIYRISDHWSCRAAYSLAFKNLIYTSFIPSASNNEKYLSSRENLVMFNQQYEVRYEKLINYHSLNAFVIYRNYRDNVYWNVDSSKNVELEGLAPEDNIYLRGSQAIFGEKGSVIRNISSGIASFNYSYRKRYTISLIADLDHLKEGFYVDRNGLFSSVAIDWDLARENFFQMPRWLDAFHLYANWGQAGNYPLNSLSNDLYSRSSSYTAGDSLVNGAYISNLANHYISDERVNEYNFGSEIRLFHERLILSGDYFIKYNSNLLIQRTIPHYYGGGIYYQNIGAMENKGVELSLEVTPFERPDFGWTARFGYSSNRQMITKLYDSVPISFNSIDVLYPDFYARENEVLGAITGYSYQGVWDDNIHSDEVNGYQKYFNHYGIAYLKLDTVNTRRLTSNDKTIIGNSIPRFTCNWINLVRYKNFTCEMLWYGVIGVDKYNATRASTYITGTNSAVRDIVMDTMNYHTNSIFYESSFFVEDASFVRLKTLSFRYTQPMKIASKVSIEYSLSFENLVTLTRYSGYDPEATSYTNNNFTDNAIDKGSYPNPRGVYLSINLSF
jgi:TonB-dependent starch-binding outer membrane protein SusC